MIKSFRIENKDIGREWVPLFDLSLGINYPISLIVSN